ncbi:MAG: rhomboid family intramembrane serine protease, partial [Cytophagia bacterium]|nr:rhomboid family intramembrane serine protease [Cytophagia bacterium]
VGAATFQPNYAIHLLFLGPVKLKYIAAFTVLVSFIQSTGANAGGEIAHLGGALVGFVSIKQLQQGSDWSRPVVSVISWIKSLFKPQPKIKVSYKNTKTTSSRTTSRTKARTETKSKNAQEEIDAILDKISEKGYDALSKEEKQKLFNASKD